jgi:hypothetical protein
VLLDDLPAGWRNLWIDVFRFEHWKPEVLARARIFYECQYDPVTDDARTTSSCVKHTRD